MQGLWNANKKSEWFLDRSDIKTAEIIYQYVVERIKKLIEEPDGSQLEYMIRAANKN